MASRSPPFNPQASTLIPTIPQMIESLSKLHDKLSIALKKLTVAATATAGGQIEEAQEHQAKANQNLQLEKLLANIEHLKGALETTNELDKKLYEPIHSIETSLEEVIKRIESNPRIENDFDGVFLDAISKDMKTLKFQIPSYKKLSLAGTTAHLVDRGSGTTRQNEFKLPNLYAHKVFDESPAFIEIQEIYNGFNNICKKCFLYFAVFPENVVFKKRFLTYWWIGEDIMDPSAIGDHETPEVLSGEILEIFVDKGLIVPVKEDQKKVKKKFRMPPIVRSAAIKLAIQNNFLDYDPGNNPIGKSPGCDRIFLVKGGGSHRPKVPTALTGIKVPMAPMGTTVPTDAQAPAGTTAPMDAKVPTGMMAPRDAKAPTNMMVPMDAKAPTALTTTTVVSSDAKAPTTLMNTTVPSDAKASTAPTNTTVPTGVKAPTDRMDQKLEEGIESIFNVSQPFPDSALEWLAKKGVVDMRTVKVVEWLLKLRNLKVLYLGRWQSAVDEQQIEVESYEFLKGLKKMKRLRLLSLQGISWINKLPNSIRTLSELRVLDLKSCFNLEKLPQGIGSLKRLTHLDVSGCYMLDQMPKSISKLTELRVLKGFVTGRSNLNDLKGLKMLRKLSINTSRQDFPDETDLHVLQELGEHGKLRSLTIVWGAGGVKQPSSGKRSMMRQVTEKFGKKVSKQWNQPGGVILKLLPKELEKLEMDCLPEEKLPQWLNPSNLTSLKRLYIRGGKLAELGNEPWTAEVVRLKYLTELKIEWRELQKSFPNLSYLQKVQCPRVTFCPCDANGVWMKP